MSSVFFDYSNLGKPIATLLEEIGKMHDIVDVTQRSLGVTQAMPNAVKVLAKVDNQEDGEAHRESLKRVERIARIAKEEIEAGFPFVYSQAVIMLYSYLEAAIKNLIICFFKRNEIATIKEIAGIKISFSEFIKLDEVEKYDYLFVQYEKLLTVGMQYGVNRFENLLSPINLSGKVNLDVAKAIFELSQTRNNILHRAGVADKQFIVCCPWLKYAIGDKLKVTAYSYEQYYSAVCRYVTSIIVRLGEKTGKDMSEFKEDH